jgi:hypothetical protein
VNNEKSKKILNYEIIYYGLVAVFTYGFRSSKVQCYVFRRMVLDFRIVVVPPSFRPKDVLLQPYRSRHCDPLKLLEPLTQRHSNTVQKSESSARQL